MNIILIGNVITYTRTVVQGKSVFSNILGNITSLYQESLFIDQISELMKFEEESTDNKIKITRIDDIELRKVCFHYSDGKIALKDIDLKVNKGKKIAILGRNGSGKTTLIKLVLGLYENYTGEILINGINLKEIDKTSYYNSLTVVFQDYIRYEATLYENIKFGNLKKDDLSEIKKYCEIFDLENLGRNNQDLEVQLGNWFDNGINVSTGQWQKIALARAFYKSGSFFLFDEPNSALDKLSERKFLTYYNSSLNKCSGIIISHKFNDAIMLADEIIVLQDGEIIERGSHDDLLNCKGIYYELLLNET